MKVHVVSKQPQVSQLRRRAYRRNHQSYVAVSSASRSARADRHAAASRRTGSDAAEHGHAVPRAMTHALLNAFRSELPNIHRLNRKSEDTGE